LLVDLQRVEQLVDKYVDCWKPHRLGVSGLYEDNDFGCEHLQVIRNGFELEDFNHDELSQLTTLLTRELRGQINSDHKFFWAWVAFLTFHFPKPIPIFHDVDWQSGFADIINLALSARRRFPAGPAYRRFQAQTLRHVNHHLLETESNKWKIAGPLAFSVLEGLLRRKNSNYVNIDGSVKKPFQISDAQGQTGNFDTKGRNRWLNRIDDSIRCFEQIITVDRGRPCPYLQQMKTEIISQYPTTGLDIYDMIDVWRNDLLHGKEYWQYRAPLLLNLICLLVIDEIEPTLYNSQMNKIKETVEWIAQTQGLGGVTARWFLFPPHI
jgi:hypothetical protein